MMEQDGNPGVPLEGSQVQTALLVPQIPLHLHKPNAEHTGTHVACKWASEHTVQLFSSNFKSVFKQIVGTKTKPVRFIIESIKVCNGGKLAGA